MRGISKTTIIGRLGQDPEVRYSNSGTAIANLSVATSYKPKNGEEETEWHRVVLFGRTAEVAQQYLKKGSTVYIEGRNRTRKWQDNSGQDRWTTEVLGWDMQMLGDRSEQRPQTQPADHAQKPAQPETADPNMDGFDDIPF